MNFCKQKLEIFLLFVILILTNNIIAQIWSSQNSGTSFHLNSVFFIDQSNGFIAGNSGMILHSSDAGKNWNVQNSGVTNNLQKIVFLNDSLGWCAGFNGVILNTINRGSSWEIQNINSGYNLFSIFFLNADTGWACGSNGKFLKTSDGGNTWIETTINHPVMGIRQLNDLHFDDSHTGWIVANGFIVYYTTDGGNNWSTYGSGAGYNIQSITRTTNRLYICANETPNLIFKSDGENIWNHINGTDFITNSIFFIDDFHGWIVGENGNISHTFTGGDSWWSQQVNLGSTLNEVFFLDDTTGWAVGDNGTILHTDEGNLVSIKDSQKEVAIENFKLSQNYPNPFNPTTTIKYNLPQSSVVLLQIFNNLGEKIKTIYSGPQTSGSHEVVFDGGSLPSGIYFYQITTKNFTQTKKCLLLK
ncbi:MAG: YCF48-related protein [Desulfobacterales bacterium]